MIENGMATFVKQSASRPRLALIALAAAALALLTCLGHYLLEAERSIVFPFGLDYGEGIVWDQMRRIMAGHAYGQIAQLPAIVFHYPPAYHVIAAVTARATGLDELAAGRLVSVIATLIAALCLAGITRRLVPAGLRARVGWLCGGSAALIVLSTKPVLIWSMLMRTDMQFLAFSMAGFGLALAALRQPRLAIFMAFPFVAAIFTKQTAIAAPAAAYCVLILVHPRYALVSIALAMAIALSGVAWLEWATDGGFLRHILAYNLNRFSASRILDIPKIFGAHCGYVAVAIWGMYRRLRTLTRDWPGGGMAAWGRILRTRPDDAAYIMALVYLAIATLMLALVFKSGSSINYFLEWMYLISAFAALALADIFVVTLGLGSSPPPRLARAAVIVPCLIAIQALGLFYFVKPEIDGQFRHRAELARLTTLIAATGNRPVITDDMVALLLAGKSVFLEPSIFAELAGTRAWDQKPYIAMIHSRRFAFFVSKGHANDGHEYDSRYTPEVAAAITSAYPQHRYLARFELSFPPLPLPTYANGLSDHTPPPEN